MVVTGRFLTVRKRIPRYRLFKDQRLHKGVYTA